MTPVFISPLYVSLLNARFTFTYIIIVAALNLASVLNLKFLKWSFQSLTACPITTSQTLSSHNLAISLMAASSFQLLKPKIWVALDVSFSFYLISNSSISRIYQNPTTCHHSLLFLAQATRISAMIIDISMRLVSRSLAWPHFSLSFHTAAR